MDTITLDSKSLTLEDVVNVARHNYKVVLSDAAVKNIKKAEEAVRQVVNEQRVVYGVTTGFGAFKDKIISKENIKKLQRNILMSHATGVGEPFSEEVTRAIMLLRANTLASGNCGVRLETVQTLIAMLNARVHPFIPQKGSVGASGDLAPLAHLALVLIGEGKAFYRGELLSGREAMEKAASKNTVNDNSELSNQDKAALKILELGAKEGLSLINGTQAMTGVAALTVYDAENVMKTADIIGACSLDALRGSQVPFDERLHKLRAHPGQLKCAENMRRLLKESEINLSHKDCDKVQDAYSLRCIPQVHGASRDALDYAKKVVEIEINSVTDNPIIFPDTQEFLSGGNFHGQPVAIAMDCLGIALSEIANISERRIERMVNSKLSEDLPGFLIKEGGLNSGFMITQYTAAALVSENKVLAHPASVDSIPTSANQEDHVSMGTISARKANEILFNVENVLAIELLCACQGLDFFEGVKPGVGIRVVHRLFREKIPHLSEDRLMYPDINLAKEMICTGVILSAVEKEVGRLK